MRLRRKKIKRLLKINFKKLFYRSKAAELGLSHIVCSRPCAKKKLRMDKTATLRPSQNVPAWPTGVQQPLQASHGINAVLGLRQIDTTLLAGLQHRR